MRVSVMQMRFVICVFLHYSRLTEKICKKKRKTSNKKKLETKQIIKLRIGHLVAFEKLIFFLNLNRKYTGGIQLVLFEHGDDVDNFMLISFCYFYCYSIV